MFGFLRGKKKEGEQSEQTPVQAPVVPSAESAVEVAPKSQESKPLISALSKSREGLWGRIKGLFSLSKKVDEETIAEMEAILIGADVGVATTAELLESTREEVKAGRDVSAEAFREALKSKMLGVLTAPNSETPSRRQDGPSVVLVIGVNGVGKTTTVGKVASKWRKEGRGIILCAADTFRAAAVEQLIMWGERVGAPVVHGAENAKPATVVFDGITRAQKDNADILMIDTAGRLHNKQNLMSELEGIKNSLQRHQPSAPHEVWLVVDGATGQNALIQAREFNNIAKLTGVIITKLDGTAKGGIVLAIARELKIPIRFIGVGEGVEDLRPFVPEEFVDAILGEGDAYTLQETAVSANAEKRRQRRG
jgi:fused signal recognition particle receptor